MVLITNLTLFMLPRVIAAAPATPTSRCGPHIGDHAGRVIFTRALGGALANPGAHSEVSRNRCPIGRPLIFEGAFVGF